MALPASGQITYNQIATELGISTSNANMDSMTALATGNSGITNEPDSTADWYGYSNVTIPTAPSGGSAGNISGQYIGVSWTDNSNNETEFRIYRSEDGGGYVYYDFVTTNVTSYDDDFVEDAVLYQYRIYSYNTAGLSATFTQTNSVLFTSA